MPKQKDGRYRAKVTIGHDADGKPIIKYVSGRTKRELEESKDEIKRRHVNGITSGRHDIMFNQAVLDWYEHEKKPHISPASRSSYVSIINKHILPAFQDKQLKAVRKSNLQAFFNEYTDMCRTTVSYMHTIIKGTLESACDERIIPHNPAGSVKISSHKKEARRALTDAETAAVLHVGNTHPRGLLLLVFYYTGVRRGEGLGLQWSDNNYSLRKTKIERDIDFLENAEGSLKTFESYRELPIADPLYDAFMKVVGIGNAYIFQAPTTGSFLSKSTFSRLWAELMKAVYDYDNTIEHKETPAYLKQLEKYEAKRKRAIREKKEFTLSPPEPEYQSILTPHYFRHNFASLCYDAGVDVLTTHKWLGHKDVRTTLQIYTHLSKQKEAENVVSINKAFQKVAAKLPG